MRTDRSGTKYKRVYEAQGGPRGDEITMSEQGKERRRFDRIPSDMDIRFSGEGSENYSVGKLLNLNGTGICFESDHAVEVGSRLKVETVEDNVVVPILDGTIEVVRSTEKDGHFEVAGEFLELKS